MNVADRIFYDIQVHGIKSVLKNKDWYKTYQPTHAGADEKIPTEIKIRGILSNDEKIFLVDRIVRTAEIGNLALKIESEKYERSLTEIFVDAPLCDCGHCKQAED